MWHYGRFLLFACALLSCTDNPNGNTVIGSTSATIGEDGGTLKAAGVTVTLPPGSLPASTLLKLEVFEGPLIRITPDLGVAVAAEVALGDDVWPADKAGIGMHLASSGEWYRLGDLTPTPRGMAFTTFEFSDVMPKAPTAAPDDCLGTIWQVQDVCGNPTESTVTTVPVKATRVNAECLRNVQSLVGANYDLVDKSYGGANRRDDEGTLMSQEAAAALAKVVGEVAEIGDGSYRLWLNGAWDSSQTKHDGGSFHYTGAAVDLALCRVGADGKCHVKEAKDKVTDPALLGQVPGLLLKYGFNWVWYEDTRHIHASISSPSLSQCAACTPLEKRCGLGNTVERCGPDRSWHGESTCAFACVAAACVGECLPLETKCEDGLAVTCGADYHWGPGQPCPFACVDGACTGECVPASKKCDGGSLLTCNQAGSWSPPVPCPYTCSGGACTGECAAGAVRCDGQQPQVCSWNNAWANHGAPCAHDCIEGDCFNQSQTCGSPCSNHHDCPKGWGCYQCVFEQPHCQDPVTCPGCP